jgi:hypothetical protein
MNLIDFQKLPLSLQDRLDQVQIENRLVSKEQTISFLIAQYNKNKAQEE